MKKSSNLTPTIGDKEKQIIDVYLAEVYRVGVSNVTLQSLAKKVGLAYSSVHYYFGGKDVDIADAASRYILISVQNFIETTIRKSQASDQSNVLIDYIRANFQWLKKYPSHAHFWVYSIQISHQRPQLRDLHNGGAEIGTQRIKSFLYEEVGKGTYGALQEHASLAIKIHTALTGGVFRSYTAGGDLETHALCVIDIVERLIQTHRVVKATKPKK